MYVSDDITHVAGHSLSVYKTAASCHDSRQIDWGRVTDPERFVDDCVQIRKVVCGLGGNLTVIGKAAAHLLQKTVQLLRVPKQQVSGRRQDVGIQLGAGDDKSEPVAHHLCLGDSDPLALIESVDKRREKIGTLLQRIVAGHAAIECAGNDAPVALARLPRHAEEEKTQYGIQGTKPTQRNADRAELGVEEVPLDPGVLIHVLQATG